MNDSISDDRRFPYREFSPSLIESFLAGRRVNSAELMSAGKCNTNYKLLLSDGSIYHLRLRSRGNPERENFAMNLVRDLVPVPAEIDRGESWSVFTFLDGEHLADHPEDSGAAAAILVRIAAVRFESGGMIGPNGTVTPWPFRGMGGFIVQMLDNAAVLAWIGAKAADELRAIIAHEAERICEIDATCRLVHGDFNPTNILIRDGRVSGVLDWEFCHSGTPYMDIGNLLRNTDPAYHDLVETGLREGGMELPGDWKERAELVDLASHLEFLTSALSDGFKGSCVRKIEQFIEKFAG